MSEPQATFTSDFSNQLDPQQIELLRGLRKGTLLPQLLRTYRDQAVKQIEDLRTAAAKDDAETLRFIAHTLKSASFSIGANGIGELCQQLETNARAHQLGNNATLCGELVERFTVLVSEIEQYLTP
jgi:HPt (histidine-containing phosphotransfer) domain-containing protein